MIGVSDFEPMSLYSIEHTLVKTHDFLGFSLVSEPVVAPLGVAYSMFVVG